MMNIIAAIIVMVCCVNFAQAGDCPNNNCTIRSRAVTVTREIVAVPVEVTRRTVDVTRKVGRKTFTKVRDVVR